MPKNEESFTELTETFLREIMKEVRTSVDVDIKTKVEVLKEMTRWVQVKNKVSPEKEEGSKIDEYRNALKTGNDVGSGNSRRVGRGGGKKARAQIDKLEDVQNGSQIPEKTGYRHTGASGQNAGRIQGDVNGLVDPPKPFSVINGIDSDGSIVVPNVGSKPSRGFGGL